MRIDVHAHYFEPEYMDCLARLGNTTGSAVGRAPGGRVSLDERVELMDQAGIDVQVLSLGVQMPYFEREADAVAAARLGNDVYADVGRRYTGRFKAFVAPPLPHVDAALAEVERGLDRLGMAGVTVGCTVAGRTLDDPTFEPFFAELDRRGAVLFIHPQGVGAVPQPDVYGLTWMVGSPIEDTFATLQLLLSGMLARYPNIRLIVPHLGGTLPFLFQRLDDALERHRMGGSATAIEGGPSQYLRRVWFDTVNGYPPALRCACEAFGTDRLVLGTDFPYLAGEKFLRCVSYVEEALGPEEASAVLDRNAPELLQLDE